jgi:hypothetical protein
VACRYGDWTFVFDGPPESLADGDASQLEPDDDFHAITAASPLVMTPQRSIDTINHLQVDGGDSSLSHMRESSTPQSIASITATTVARQSATDNDPNTAWTSNDLPDEMTYTDITPRQLIGKRTWQQRSTDRQSALLRFRYQVVPWIESNNCKSMFGPTIMTLVRDSKIISDCISACVRTRDPSHDLSRTESAVPSRLLERLAREDTFTADVGFVLLTISSVFYTPPSEWAVIAATCEARLGQSVMSSGGFELTPEPLKSLLRLQLKVGKL